MNPIQIELDRLYGLGTNAPDGTRALVLELAPPAGWGQLSAVWKGVQSDFELPAPAIAVSGVDRLQLWFSLASPISPGAGELFLQGLRAKYLADVVSTHVRLLSEPAEMPAAPPVETSPDRWSAFVAPDLASVFADTPWLDFRPNGEGQASLLRALEPIRQAAFEAALNRLGTGRTSPAPADVRTTHEQGDTGALIFLRGVMNDESAPLALRIEAAKALLPYARRS